MRIGYILGQFPKLSETFILHEISELIRRGHDVYIFSLFNSKENIVQPEVEEYSLLERTYYPPSYHKLCIELARFDRLLFYRNRKKINKFYCIAVARHFSKIAEKLDLDVLHAHFANEPTFTAMLMSKLTEIPFTFTAHAFDIFIDPDVKALKERMENSRMVVTESNFHKKHIASITHTNSDKICVIHICPNLDKICEIRKVVECGRPDNRNSIITVSRLVEKKGLVYSIMAVKKLIRQFPNLEYTIVGDGPLKQKLLRLIRSLKLEKNVRLTGPMDNFSALKMVANSDIFVLPCIRSKNGDMDGTPTALMEAMALEVPVISTKISGIPELIENGKEGFLVKPENVEQLANALKILLQDEDIRRKMGKRGRKKIEEKFNINKEIEKLLKIWRGV